MIINKTDKVGAFIASACLIHCLVLPLLLVFVPTIGISNYEWAHDILVPLTLFNTALSMYFCRNDFKQNRIIPVLFWIGLILTTASLYHDFLMVVAGFVILTAHYLNYKRCKAQQCCNHHEG